MSRFVQIGHIILITFCFVMAELTPTEIIHKAENVLNPEKYESASVITNYQNQKVRTTMTIMVFGNGSVGSRSEIIEPARSKGTRILDKDGSLWMYNPKANVKRPLRLSLKESFQGSVFSNYDIMTSKYSDDYTAELSGTVSDTFDGVQADCYKLTLIAKRPDVTYESIIFNVRKSDCMPVRMQYFTKSGLKIKEIIFDKAVNLAGAMRPSMYFARSFENTDRTSKIEITKMKSRSDLTDNFFTVQELTR